MLAYGALEHLEDLATTRRKGAVNDITIVHGALAERLRTGLKTYKVLTSETVTNKVLRKKLLSWESGTDSDVLVVAKALRHMFAHGAFTPYGLAITKKSSQDAIGDLAAAVRAEAQDRFNLWLEGHQRS